MIEFKGQLSGSAEKRFLKRVADSGQAFLLFGELFALPFIIMLAACVQYWTVIWAYLGFSVAILLLVRIPKSKRERDRIVPKRIYTKDDEIICVAEQYTERRYIEDVKCVRDFGEFYELEFPFGKVSEKFFCQKEHLSKGSLEAFEALFDGRLVRQ